MHYPNICATRCFYDQQMLESSNFEGFRKDNFEYISNATLSAITKTAQFIVFAFNNQVDLSNCGMFQHGRDLFFLELQKNNPDLAGKITKLPKFTECVIQDNINDARIIIETAKTAKQLAELIPRIGEVNKELALLNEAFQSRQIKNTPTVDVTTTAINNLTLVGAFFLLISGYQALKDSRRQSEKIKSLAKIIIGGTLLVTTFLNTSPLNYLRPDLR